MNMSDNHFLITAAMLMMMTPLVSQNLVTRISEMPSECAAHPSDFIDLLSLRHAIISDNLYTFATTPQALVVAYQLYNDDYNIDVTQAIRQQSASTDTMQRLQTIDNFYVSICDTSLSNTITQKGES